MTKEDKQLCCAMSFHEIGTGTSWSLIKKPMMEQLPLHNVSWISPSSSTAGSMSVQTLDIRFTRDSPELFRDSDHPFRWFMAPFCSICFVSALNLDIYKQECRPAIRHWIETSFAPHKRVPTQWLVAFVTFGTGSPKDAQDAVFIKVVSDVGKDRSIHLYVHTGEDQLETNVARQKRTFDALFSQLRVCLQNSFKQRVSLYETEIHRLNSSNPSIDFRQLFLVQESLALLYQLSNLPREAQRQYAELDNLINTVAVASNVGVGIVGVESSNDDDSFAETWFRTESSTADTTLSSSAHVNQSRACSDVWAVGANVLDYSINDVRMRILKGNFKPLELKSYVFARQMYFLSSGNDSTARATRVTATLHFVQSLHSIVGGQKRQQQRQQHQQTNSDRNADYWNIYMLSVIAAIMREERAKDAIMECNDGPCLEDVNLLQFMCSRLHSLSKYRHCPQSSSLSQPLHHQHHSSDVSTVWRQKGPFPVSDYLAWCRSFAFHAAMTLKISFPDPAMQMAHTTTTAATVGQTYYGVSATALGISIIPEKEDESFSRQLLDDQGAVDGFLVALHEAILGWDSDGNNASGSCSYLVDTDGNGVAGNPSQEHRSSTDNRGISRGRVTIGDSVSFSSSSITWYSQWGLLLAKLLHVIAQLETMLDKRRGIASWYFSMSGDVLLTGGYVISALHCYQSALDAISSASPGVRAKDPPKDNHAHGAFATWTRLKFWLLRKSLLCLALSSGANLTPESSPRLDAAQTLHTNLYDQLKTINDSVRASRNGVTKKCKNSAVCDHGDDDIDITWAVPGMTPADDENGDDNDDDSMMMSFSATEDEDDRFEEKNEEEKILPGSLSSINTTPTATALSFKSALVNDTASDASSLQLSYRFVRVLVDHTHDHEHDQTRSKQHFYGDDKRVEASMTPKTPPINVPTEIASFFRVIVQAEILHVESTPTPTSGAIPRRGGRIHGDHDQRTKARKKPCEDERDCHNDEESILVISCDATCRVIRKGDDETAVVSSIDENGCSNSGDTSSHGDSSGLAVGERLLRAFQFSVQIPPTKEKPVSNSGSTFSSNNSNNQDKLKTDRIEKALERIEKALERDELATKQSEHSPVKSPIKSPVKRDLVDDDVVRENVTSEPLLLVDLTVRYCTNPVRKGQGSVQRQDVKTMTLRCTCPLVVSIMHPTMTGNVPPLLRSHDQKVVETKEMSISSDPQQHHQ